MVVGSNLVGSSPAQDYWFFYSFFIHIWVFFHGYSRFTGKHGKGEAISLTPLYHSYYVTDISRTITAESLLLHIAASLKPQTFGFLVEVVNH